MLRRPAAVLVLALIVLAMALVGTGASGAAAQTDPTPTAPESQGIIPEPNSGAAPTDAGDRGGALQSLLFVVMIGGASAVGALAYRESKRVRSERGF